MADILYAAEKATTTLRGLAVSTEPDLRERCYHAYLNQFMQIPTDDLTPSLLALHEKMIARITRVAATGNEGNVKATLLTIDDAEARQLLGAMVAICEGVAILAHGGTPGDGYEGYL